MGILGNRTEQKIFVALTDKQRMFVTEYAVDLNATRAAREAGYRHPNVAARSCKTTRRSLQQFGRL